MVTKNQIKIIAELHQKKYRQLYNLFIAEGQKCISELLNSDFELLFLYESESVFNAFNFAEKHIISQNELKKMSALTNPNNCLAVFRIKKTEDIVQKNTIVALDNISDPGNLGTIIRLCDWFGIKDLVCSQSTVDLYNPKVVQASMGSLTRVNVSYVNLQTFLIETSLPIFGTFTDGNNVYTTKLPKDSVLLMGNEGNGISTEIANLVSKKLSIPRFGTIQSTESLNVATATAIFLSEFKRNSN
jgi:TrmH family RNA methyltransferase